MCEEDVKVKGTILNRAYAGGFMIVIVTCICRFDSGTLVSMTEQTKLGGSYFDSTSLLMAEPMKPVSRA